MHFCNKNYRWSAGLFTPLPPLFNTCVYIIVVLTSFVQISIQAYS